MSTPACRLKVEIALTDCLGFFAAVWNWTSSCRRTSYNHWWRGFVQQRIPTSPPCLTPRRLSPPPQKESPKLTPRSTLAGNFGSCEKMEPCPTSAFNAQDLSVVHICLVIHHLLFNHIFWDFFVDLVTDLNGELDMWILADERMCDRNVDTMDNSKCHADQKCDSDLFLTHFLKLGVKEH